jgi:hypothetical protein
MGVKAVPAACARDDLDPEGVQQGLVDTLLITALIEPGETRSNSLSYLLHGGLEVRQVPQPALEVRDDRCHWFYVNTTDGGPETRRFQQHDPAAHEGIEDGYVRTRRLAIVGWPKRRIGGGDSGGHQGTRGHGEAARKPLVRLIGWPRTCSFTLREHRDVADGQVARIEE